MVSDTCLANDKHARFRKHSKEVREPTSPRSPEKASQNVGLRKMWGTEH